MGAQEITLLDRLAIIDLIETDISSSGTLPPLSKLYENLWDLINRTVKGSRIDPLKPHESLNGFRVFELRSEIGEYLGHLNTIYLKKPLPCYYLVYVEVAPPFRRKGLGHKILRYFREFLIERSAIGILDNIIPPEDPTYGIYLKHAWEPIESIIEENVPEGCENYMVYLPPKFQKRDIRGQILKLILHIRRKRPAIDMRDNERMVQRTIEEFKNLYNALLLYFKGEIGSKRPSPLMRFMFTRFVTRLLAFRRKISELIGYTGGDSLEQLPIDDYIKRLKICSRVSSDPGNATFIWGDRSLWHQLPEELKRSPSPYMDSLSNYMRPMLKRFLKDKGYGKGHEFTIEDILELGFDPTRLKEIKIEGVRYIAERLPIKRINEVISLAHLLETVRDIIPSMRINDTLIKINPPQLIIRDRGNAYVFRRKIPAIHWDEAFEELHKDQYLSSINSQLGVGKKIIELLRGLESQISSFKRADCSLITYFVPWDIKTNRVKIVIDFGKTYIPEIWLT